MKLRSNSLTSIDLFAGCGGLSLGLEQAGFNTIYVNELNHDAKETYLINREYNNKFLRKYSSSDIKSVVYNNDFYDDLISGFREDYKLKSNDIDLISGGPPCQGFSGIGIRRSYSVNKIQLPSNHLYQDMAYFIKKIKPRAFIFENVEGLLRSRWTSQGSKGEIFHDVFSTFSKIDDYYVKWKLIYAKEYGVPQNRPRVFIVGFRNDVFSGKSDDIDAVRGGFLPEPIYGYPDILDVLDDICDNNFTYGGSTNIYPRDAISNFQLMLRTNLDGTIYKKGDIITDHVYSNHSELIRKKFTYMIANNGNIPLEFKTKKFSQRLLPKRWGNHSPSITITSMPDDFVHYKQARSLTVREWARLQTFPDYYLFSGKRTTGGIRRAGNPREAIFDREVPKYTQIGNAVPPLLAKIFGQHIAKILRK